MIAGAIVTAIATDNVAAVSFLFIILTSHITQFSQYVILLAIVCYAL